MTPERIPVRSVRLGNRRPPATATPAEAPVGELVEGRGRPEEPVETPAEGLAGEPVETPAEGPAEELVEGRGRPEEPVEGRGRPEEITVATGTGPQAQDADEPLAGPMVALVAVRDGALPAGAAEAVAEAGGVVVVAGSGTEDAAATLALPGGTVIAVELGDYAPGRWAAALADVVAGYAVVLLPASADGRDLAPRLAHATGRPLHAGATSVTPGQVCVARHGGLTTETRPLDGPCVVTLIPGVRGAPTGGPDTTGAGRQGRPAVRRSIRARVVDAPVDAVVVALEPPDPATMDLTEAPRVLVGGAGLGDVARFAVLAEVAAGLGASPGATRVVADAGWVDQHRYIGTTGVSIDPELYIAVGVSGAVQHVTGIGHPVHIVAVNTDPSAPLMAMADLAVVTDGRALLDELAARLAHRRGDAAPVGTATLGA